jgi:hypothetical protein
MRSNELKRDGQVNSNRDNADSDELCVGMVDSLGQNQKGEKKPVVEQTCAMPVVFAIKCINHPVFALKRWR